MRLYKRAIILTIILVLLIGVYLFVTNMKKSPEQDARSFEKIVDLDTFKMKEMTIENEDERLFFVKDDKEWELKYPENVKYDPSKLNSVAINFSSVFVEKVIEEDASDLEQYGLDRPIIVSAKMEDGSVETLEIGHLTPTKGAYYVKKKNENKVYTTDTYTINKVIVKKNDIRDKTMFSIHPDDISKISMERRGALVFCAEREDEDSDWTLTSPIEGNVNINALGPMLEAITNTYANEYIEEEPEELDLYGLKNPSYILEFETYEGVTRLLMGREIKEVSEIYVMEEGSNEVCTISLEAYTFLDKPLKEIVEVFAFITNIWDVERIEVKMDGYTADCVLDTDPDQDTDKDKFYFNGKDASMKDENDKQPFRTYYTSLIAVTLSEIEPNANPTGEAEISFTYYRKVDPKVMKVEFIPKDERYYYVMRNGKYSGILVEKSKFDQPEGVRDSYNKLIEALKKE